MNKLSILIENYIKLECKRREEIQKSLDIFLDGTEIRMAIAKRLIPKNSKSKIGVNTELVKAYEALVSEFLETKVYVRCAGYGDVEQLVLDNDSTMTVYTEKELCPYDETSSWYVELKLLGLMALAHASNTTRIYINEGENSLQLSNKLCGEILSGNKEYCFIARNQSLLKYNLKA